MTRGIDHCERFMKGRPMHGTVERLIRQVGARGALDILLEEHEMLPENIRTDDDLNAALDAFLFITQRMVFEQSATSFSAIALTGPAGLEHVEFLLRIGEAMAPGDDSFLDVLRNRLEVYRHIIWYELAKRRTYEVSPALGIQLRDTELRGLRCADLRLPFESVYLEVPPEVELEMGQTQGKSLRASGVYIVDDRHDFEGRGWRFMITAPDPEAPESDCLFMFFIGLDDEMAVDQALESFDEVKRLRPGTADFGFDFWRPLFKWSMNAMIYATWPDADREDVYVDPTARGLWDRIKKQPPGSAKGKKLREELKHLNARSVIYLGRGVVAENEPAAGSGPSLAVRVRVSGHWKHQPHGPNHSLRLLQWIQPYWKGAEDSPLREATHRLH